ncbi:SGNH/GDSL hydrolase family protein [Noviherbaspirillum saxi]|uniref:SGNH/GDSL hydrolase family protein n=1 Tax=Noviherbaspirillum saxi TaxID=2320863 RepID=A0A3A3FSL8_9BURK|nr:SGNH/GDSL hydrolase family protein [Noviherbaspirillum saxi]RJF97191.1 SGNH/GDSL hydrolase family protein [Noviherbaspirillum saxi]
MRHYLPELLAFTILPFLIVQGRRTRRRTPRLPEAGGPVQGIAGAERDGAPLSLLAIGESPVAGVGVGTHEDAITGQLASALSRRLARPVHWHACGKNGATVAQGLEQLVPTIPAAKVDLVLVAFGVNDTTAFHSPTRWRADLRKLLIAIEARCSPALTIVSGVPQMAHFPALPQPLRHVMGIKASTLDTVARALVATRPHTLHVPLELNVRDRSLMASDGYHPSAAGCTAWAALLAERIADHRI